MALTPRIPERSPAGAYWPTWPDAVLALLAGGLSFALYARTLVPFVLPGDSGEFQVLAYELGIAHTPGYPIYLLLAKLFTFLPIGDIAYRVNLFSALMAAVTVSGVYLAARLLTGQRLAAVFGALALTVSFTFWSQAIIAEVYTSGAAWVALIWLGLLAWYRAGTRRGLFLAGLCGGLGLGVHSTVALFAPSALLFLWLNRQRWPGPWRPAILGAAAGVLLYLLAFLAVDLHAPPANIFEATYRTARSDWGLSQDDLANPVQRLIFIGTAVQWRSAMFAGWDGLPSRMVVYVANLPREFAWPTILLVIAGLVMLSRREASLGWFFLTALLAHWVFAFTYRIGDIFVFYIPGYVLMALLAAYGAASGIGWLAQLASRGVPFAQAAVLAAMLVFGIWPVLAPQWWAVRAGAIPFRDIEGYPVDSQTADVARVAGRVVEHLPPNAVVFVDWYWLYPYYYAAHIEHSRWDLRFIEAAPRADRAGLPESALAFVGENIATHPILFARYWPELEHAGYRLRAREIWFTRFYQVERASP